MLNKFYQAVTNRSGDALPGYYVRLFDSTGAQITLYADESLTPIASVSGMADAAVTNENGMAAFWHESGIYDIRYYDTNDTYRDAEPSVPLIRSVGEADITPIISATGEQPNTTSGLAATSEGLTFWVDNGDGTGTNYRHDPGPVATEIGKFILDPTREDTASLIGSFDRAIISPSEAYSGTGTATLGGPRWFLGGLAPSGDDSAFCIGRNISGSLLFSHALRDESEFHSTGDSAYASFDAAQTYISNGDVKYNHGYGFQARPLMSATNGMDLFAGVSTQMRVSAGTVDRLYHVHIASLAKTGGTVSVHVGMYVSPLTGGFGENYGIFVEDNPCFFGGYIQLNNDDVYGFRQVKGGSGNFSGGYAEFVSGGGVIVAGDATASNYAAIRSYSNGSGDPKGLALNPNGGQVLVGSGSPVTGEQLEVVGAIGTSESYRVDGVKVIGNQGAAVADATDAASVITQLNALLDRCRAHGLIAT